MAQDDPDALRGVASDSWSKGAATAGALIVALLLVALVMMVASSNRRRDAAIARERHSYDVMMLTRGVDSALARSEAALGRFVISGDKGVGTTYSDQWALAGQQLDQLKALVGDTPAQHRLVDRLTLLYARRDRELSPAAASANYHRGWEALSLFNEAGKSHTIPAINRLLQTIQSNERTQLGLRSFQTRMSVDRSNFLAGLLSATGILLVLAAGALGWLSVQALAQRRRARSDAEAEADRSAQLEQAVAERTSELHDANARLQEEMAERAVAEATLRQVQKMEAVGQLTGGIAHDFNNMLAVVVAGLDLARRRLADETEEVARHIDNAMEGATRAAALTRRLLSFARAEPLLPEGINPRQLIVGMSDLLDRALGERIALEIGGPVDAWPVWVDPHQLENAILNLAVNARDAMDGGGRLTVDTANIVLARGEIGDAEAGDHVRIRVADTGAGMAPEILERVFEPFFTTKPVGKGTGLGLSQVFGFARQSQGEVLIESTIGAGTTVSLYLPRFAGAAVAASSTKPTEDALGLSEPSGQAILVVEDDIRVLGTTMSGLQELGYAPVACEDGEEALHLLETRDDIRLIISDVVMPGMTGPELIREVRRRHPEIGAMFVTGYVGEAGDAGELAGYEILRKPFTITALERAVGGAMAHLAARAAPAPAPVSAPRRARKAAARD